MNAPAEFVVLRHLTTHPDDDAYTLSKHAGLRVDSASKVMQRLGAQGIHTVPQRLARLRTQPRRPPRKELNFQAPNPLQWLRQFKGPRLVSGQVAAAEADGIDLVPATVLAYVKPPDMDEAVRAAMDAFAKVTTAREANLTIRIADPWLLNDDANSELAEKGQRLLDYDEDPTIALASELTRHG